ncbi:MAG: hypothetical protein GF346_07345 [Candidatus Eisenbacteria bacterium]|nr:hypothetical protein [Candidatus Latescibacterota bacterium]MBD3302246.1 hypothetical protein [Candidatus Eisenbacteria bacterium]
MPEREMQTRHDDPATGQTVAWGVVGAILIFVLVVALQAFFYAAEQSETRSKTYGRQPEELAGLRAEQQEKLTTYRWIDEKNGVAAIPIERAMEILARELRGQPRAEDGDREERDGP